ncbi:hypothetical protein JXQ70_02845 [bacterium]|nr:hypothetical protein [bacterium]
MIKRAEIMKHMTSFVVVLSIFAFLFSMPNTGRAAEEGGASSLSKTLEGLSFDIEAYLDYSIGQSAQPGDEEEDYNSFKSTRGYFTVKKSILPWLGVRMTWDLHQVSDGYYELRYKYLYAELKAAGAGPFTDIKAELGMGHTPWLDFEGKINPYRCQGTMPLERAGAINSADLGIGLLGNLGGKLENAKKLTGQSSYDGQWGSWHLGVYNGSGYSSSEKNEDKPIAARLTLRPLPSVLPGLQLSYFGTFGKGNVEPVDEEDIEAPDFQVNLGMISFNHPRFTITGQYFMTKGNAKGTWVDAEGEALNTEGYAAFASIKLPVADDKLTFWARYDHFDADADHVLADKTAYDLTIASLVWDFYKGNLLMLAYETTDYEEDNAGKGKVPEVGTKLGQDQKFQVVWQVKI